MQDYGLASTIDANNQYFAKYMSPYKGRLETASTTGVNHFWPVPGNHGKHAEAAACSRGKCMQFRGGGRHAEAGWNLWVILTPWTPAARPPAFHNLASQMTESVMMSVTLCCAHRPVADTLAACDC